jgi:hypothetical protein
MSRQQIEAELYTTLDEITFTKHNSARYKDAFSKMSDKEFTAFFKDIKAGTRKLPVFIPPHSDTRMDFKAVLAVGERLGLNFYGHIIDTIDGVEFVSDQQVLVLKSTIRRLAQTLDAKLSVSESDSRVDAITGQVTSSDKAGSISAVEVSVLADTGLGAAATELAVVRGGDAGAYAYAKASTAATGQNSLVTAMEYRTGVGSKRAVTMLLRGKHITTNL